MKKKAQKKRQEGKIIHAIKNSTLLDDPNLISAAETTYRSTTRAGPHVFFE
jgi:hypothetical protein